MLFLTLLAELGGWNAIQENSGLAITITGMAIVFTALALIASFIAALPHLLEALSPYLPKMDHHGVRPSPAEQSGADQEQIVAAIGFVLHQEANQLTKK